MKKIRIGLIIIATITTIGLIITLYLNNWILANNLSAIYLLIITNVFTFTSGILYIISETKKTSNSRKRIKKSENK